MFKWVGLGTIQKKHTVSRDSHGQNEDSTFEKHSKDIYPTELELKKENNSNSSASFLDVYIYIENREFHAKSFDKQDNFESYCKDAILLLHCP